EVSPRSPRNTRPTRPSRGSKETLSISSRRTPRPERGTRRPVASSSTKSSARAAASGRERGARAGRDADGRTREDLLEDGQRVLVPLGQQPPRPILGLRIQEDLTQTRDNVPQAGRGGVDGGRCVRAAGRVL